MRLTAAARERVRRNSKVLLGNSDRAQVAVAIQQSEDGLVNATDLALELGMPNNRVRAQLLAFAEADLLTPGPPGPGKHWYLRKEHDFWKACRSLLEVWSGERQERGATREPR